MKYITWLILVLGLRLACTDNSLGSAPILAAPTAPHAPTSERAEGEITTLARKNIKQALAQIMAQARRGDTNQVCELSPYADAALPYLRPYIHEPGYVQLAVIQIASYSHQPAAIDILSTMLEDKSENSSAPGEAIKALYSYENAQLLTGDAPRLKKNLIAFISQTPSYAEAILLLSCFRRDATAITFLQHHGKLYPKTTTQINAGGPSAAVPVPVCCDLSLARLGDAAALGRVQSYLKQEGSKQQEFIFDAIRWINEKAVLLQMVELLKDKHNLKKINFEHYGATQTIYLRVCDVALKALNYKAGFSNHYYLDPTDKVSDAELERAYPKLKQFFVDKL